MLEEGWHRIDVQELLTKLDIEMLRKIISYRKDT